MTRVCVHSFSSVHELPSPLLVREEHSSELFHVVGATIGQPNAMADADYFERLRRARSTLAVAGYLVAPCASDDAPLLSWRHADALVDLLASGYAEHLLTLDLFRCGLSDEAFVRLTRALEGNAPYLNFLGLSDNPISSASIVPFAESIGTRVRYLMLPLLKWLHLGVADFGDDAALALAAALHAGALPSLEALECFRGLPLPVDAATNTLVDPGLGAIELSIVCQRREIWLEIGTDGNDHPGNHVHGIEVLATLDEEARRGVLAAWEGARGPFELEVID